MTTLTVVAIPHFRFVTHVNSISKLKYLMISITGLCRVSINDNQLTSTVKYRNQFDAYHKRIKTTKFLCFYWNISLSDVIKIISSIFYNYLTKFDNTLHAKQTKVLEKSLLITLFCSLSHSTRYNDYQHFSFRLLYPN